MISGDQAGRVLVLCHANVCRSPLAAYHLTTRLAPVGWQVESRGTHARDGIHMCRVVAQAVVAEGGRSFVDGFASRRVGADDLTANLILTASATEKSELALLDASTRRRTFTLKEAAHLAEMAPPSLDAQELAEAWDALRRGGALAEVSARGGLDIPDVHLHRWTRHAPVIAAVEDASARIATAAGVTRAI